MLDRYEVIIAGGGHAGCEAAAAAARSGAHVLLLAIDARAIGSMSCNPAIGGVGKGHLVREIDVFGGIIAEAADDAAIHYRMLNASKGAAVHGPRVQADRGLYRASIQRRLSAIPGLDIGQGEVTEIRLDGSKVAGVVIDGERSISAATVILASGTFLGGRLFRGWERLDGGRIDEPGAHRLAQQIRDIGIPVSRLKTGTPPRLDGRTINWSGIARQESDAQPWTMAAATQRRANPQLFCGITRTNPATHDLIRSNFDQSPLFSGDIGGRGPRYCPSIEDKVRRFADRDGHQIFLEPETRDGHHIYPNGISTSLPTEVQQRFLRTIAGLSEVEIVAPGYAVEYDHVDPRRLSTQLESRDIDGLFFAGQINGTTGYEEAAAQGLVAGLAASARVTGRVPTTFDRASSYIGVMIDDLTLQGVTEPYRMLTARAEHRLHLRADNAEARLGAAALATTALTDAQRAALSTRAEHRARAHSVLATMPPATLAIDDDVLTLDALEGIPMDIRSEILSDWRYAPYVRRQRADVERMKATTITLPATFDYAAVRGLSSEMVERLSASRPDSLAQASRLRGVTPAALTALLVAIRTAA
ncbi:tRNA uridine-5-carboxymethylaminomethyl(34) synthesis enzyme MnmG [Sphingomonas abietis]|uniref:tRNA uridine 5-carboxymethylaminomethyl modification enzyme MnmG n=1 Tax=Sphingomonas abietis TaxID=3012344 RepID=A0ABY7NRJ0_9SPHN|nr:tRNA uridine-5-carboxymethylaminomethyl(34) synthesis enzyme MnmG [Sphingomonas abietis]WBO22574.1 tRNA uridine-5-carboxymethylaminomethyl(34) synthesis enzyme MnmG [Sphingomonas abietis]